MIEFTSTWDEAQALVYAHGNELKEMCEKNNVAPGDFSSVKPGDNPYDFTCKWRGVRFTRLDSLIAKMSAAYHGLSIFDIRLIIMSVGVMHNMEKAHQTTATRTFSSSQEFCRVELARFQPVALTTDKWDCAGEIPTEYVPYLSKLRRPWTVEQIKSAITQELDAYNRSLPKGMGHAKISKDSLDIGFEMAIQEYYESFDETIRQELAYDGSDPKKQLGWLIDTLQITGNRDLQIAKLHQFCVNVKRSLYPEKGFKREWHVCPTVVGKGGTGKTETLLHFLVKPLMGRATATRFTELADSRWTRAFTKYNVALMDDIGYDDFTDARSGVIKQMLTAEKKLDRMLGGNKDSSFTNLYLEMSLLGSSNYHIADLTNDEALLRRIVELPSAKRGRQDLVKVRHLDPLVIYRSIDENNLGFNPLVDDAEVSAAWAKDIAEGAQHHWIFRGLRAKGYLPMSIEQWYTLPEDKVELVEIAQLTRELGQYHKSEYGIAPRHRINIMAKLEEVGIICTTHEVHGKVAKLLAPLQK